MTELPQPTQVPGLALRWAVSSDVPDILRLIQALALYERMPEACVATEEKLQATLFDRSPPAAEVILADYESSPVGFALFFHNYSTWLAMPGIYLEDLFVYPDMRGKGIGKALLTVLAHVARERKCGRIEWSVLDWNQPSIDFYLSLGSTAMDEWTVHRVEGPGIDRLAGAFPGAD